MAQFFPRMATIVHLAIEPSPSRQNFNSLSRRSVNQDYPTIVIHPSMQLLDSRAENGSSFMRYFSDSIQEELSSAGIVFHLLPSDELISLSSDPSDYLAFLDNYLEETGLQPVDCGLRVPSLSREVLTHISSFFRQKKLSMASLPSTVQLLTNPARMSKYLATIISLLPSKLLIHAPAVEPSWYPLLVYAGIDIFDTLAIEKFTNQSMYMTPAGQIPLENIIKTRNYPCTCPACNQMKEYESEKEKLPDFLFEHNFTQAEQSVRLIRQVMTTNTLRDLVKSSFASIPPAAALLRKLDTQYGYLLEERLSVSKSFPLLCSYESDLTRPEVQRFVQRAMEFKPSPLTRICLILPCSRHKPYSSSKTHQLFQLAVKKAIGNKYRSVLSEVIVTSPLGAVPRELEGIYPAAHYDIPVTGDWSSKEIKRAVNYLKNYINKLPPDTKLIAHVSGAEADICREVLMGEDIVFTSENRSVTSGESLADLGQELRKVIKENAILPVRKGKHARKIHSLRAIADYQFGNQAGQCLVRDDDHIRENRAGITVTSADKTRVAILSRENGYFTIATEGAIRLAAGKYHLVIFGGEKFEGNAIYCPGIISADHRIRPGDDVMIMDESGVNLLGTGRSTHYGKFLEENDYGLGVSVRKKVVK